MLSAPECLWEDSSRANESKITASFQSLRRLHASYQGQGCAYSIWETWDDSILANIVDAFASSSWFDDDDDNEDQIKRLLRRAAVAAPHCCDTFCLVG
jgi:hypothetical protein